MNDEDDIELFDLARSSCLLESLGRLPRRLLLRDECDDDLEEVLELILRCCSYCCEFSLASTY